MELNKIICGDALEVLKTFPDESVDCVITSPPYWGLRDYGTATWEGGDEKCDHKMPPLCSNKSTLAGYTSENVKLRTNSQPCRETCKKCGAKRIDNQLGLEKTPEEYVAKMVEVFREVRRVLKREGTLWLNLGDTYIGGGRGFDSPKQRTNKGTEGIKNMRLGPGNGLKSKDLVGIPWRVAFALRTDGWYLRQDIIWAKPNPMPESVTDRCTKSHEYIFLLSKSSRYYFDNETIKESAIHSGRVVKATGSKSKNASAGYGNDTKMGFTKEDKLVTENRNKRSVWTVTTKPFAEAHFATFPEDLIVPMVKAGCPVGGIVFDPFIGAGTTGLVAQKLSRNYIGIELNPEYIKIAEKRLQQKPLL